MVKRFGKTQPPSILDNSDALSRKFSTGMTVFRSDQCPYIEDATNTAIYAAKGANIECRVIQLKSAAEVRQLSPSPFGVFGIMLNGQLLSYHYMLQKDLVPLLAT